MRVGDHDADGQRIDDGVDAALLQGEIGEGAQALLLESPCRAFEVHFFQCPVDGDAQLVGFEGFGQQVVGAVAHGFGCGLDRTETGDDDHDDVGVSVADGAQHLHAVDVWQFQIEQYDVDLLLGQDVEPLIPPARQLMW